MDIVDCDIFQVYLARREPACWAHVSSSSPHRGARHREGESVVGRSRAKSRQCASHQQAIGPCWSACQ